MPSRRESILRSVTLVLAVALALTLAGMPVSIVLAAVVPALAQALVVVWLDREEPAPGLLLASAFLWGAVAAAFLALTLNQEIGSLLATVLGRIEGELVTSIGAAPVIEEVAKGIGIAALMFMRRSPVDPVIDGIVCGALVGIGFAMTENINYLLVTAVFGGEQHLPEMMYQRALGSLNHPIFSATLGAGMGLARIGQGHRLLPVLFALAAVLQHAAWNGFTSRLSQAALCGSASTSICDTPSAWALFAVVPLLIVVSLAPGAIILLVLITRARRRANASPRRPALITVVQQPNVKFSC